MEDPVRIFDWLAFLSVGLMSVTIPTYSLSVSFLSREARRAKLELERRRKDLDERRKELSVVSEPGVTALKEELAKYDEDIERIQQRLDALNVQTAFVLPFVSFAAGLVMTVYGFLTYAGYAPTSILGQLGDTEVFSFFAAFFLAVGILLLGRTLYRVNEAALNPETLSSFRVSFETGSTAERFTASEERAVNIIIHNIGKEMAENVLVQAYFPKDFTLLQQVGEVGEGMQDELGQELKEEIQIELRAATFSYGNQPNNPLMNFPGHPTVTLSIPQLHEDNLLILPVNMRMPPEQGNRQVHVWVWERRLGKSTYDLSFEIA
jgi:hypothetical protein